MNMSAPKPFAFAPSQGWRGNDGFCSTFVVQIGTPAQPFHVLPSTTLSEIWVPSPEGCQTQDAPSSCGELRGVYKDRGFQNNISSTFESIGTFNLVLEPQLSETPGAGAFGYDTVAVQVSNPGGPSLQHQHFAAMQNRYPMLGVFGLGPESTNSSNFDDPQLSFMTRLREQKFIPSLSYGYTAGAAYRES